MDLNVIRPLDHLEGMAFVSLLPTAAPTGLLAQTPSAGLLQSIAAWRLAAVPAVLGQLIAQPLDLRRLFSHQLLQFLHLLLQRQDNRYEGFFVQLLELAAIKAGLGHHSKSQYT